QLGDDSHAGFELRAVSDDNEIAGDEPPGYLDALGGFETERDLTPSHAILPIDQEYGGDAFAALDGFRWRNRHVSRLGKNERRVGIHARHQFERWIFHIDFNSHRSCLAVEPIGKSRDEAMEGSVQRLHVQIDGPADMDSGNGGLRYGDDEPEGVVLRQPDER